MQRDENTRVVIPKSLMNKIPDFLRALLTVGSCTHEATSPSLCLWMIKACELCNLSTNDSNQTYQRWPLAQQ